MKNLELNIHKDLASSLLTNNTKSLLKHNTGMYINRPSLTFTNDTLSFSGSNTANNALTFTGNESIKKDAEKYLKTYESYKTSSGLDQDHDLSVTLQTLLDAQKIKYKSKTQIFEEMRTDEFKYFDKLKASPVIVVEGTKLNDCEFLTKQKYDQIKKIYLNTLNRPETFNRIVFDNKTNQLKRNLSPEEIKEQVETFKHIVNHILPELLESKTFALQDSTNLHKLLSDEVVQAVILDELKEEHEKHHKEGIIELKHPEEDHHDNCSNHEHHCHALKPEEIPDEHCSDHHHHVDNKGITIKDPHESIQHDDHYEHHHTPEEKLGTALEILEKIRDKFDITVVSKVPKHLYDPLGKEKNTPGEYYNEKLSGLRQEPKNYYEAQFLNQAAKNTEGYNPQNTVLVTPKDAAKDIIEKIKFVNKDYLYIEDWLYKYCLGDQPTKNKIIADLTKATEENTSASFKAIAKYLIDNNIDVDQLSKQEDKMAKDISEKVHLMKKDFPLIEEWLNKYCSGDDETKNVVVRDLNKAAQAKAQAHYKKISTEIDQYQRNYIDVYDIEKPENNAKLKNLLTEYNKINSMSEISRGYFLGIGEDARGLVKMLLGLTLVGEVVENAGDYLGIGALNRLFNVLASSADSLTSASTNYLQWKQELGEEKAKENFQQIVSTILTFTLPTLLLDLGPEGRADQFFLYRNLSAVDAYSGSITTFTEYYNKLEELVEEGIKKVPDDIKDDPNKVAKWKLTEAWKGYASHSLNKAQAMGILASQPFALAAKPIMRVLSPLGAGSALIALAGSFECWTASVYLLLDTSNWKKFKQNMKKTMVKNNKAEMTAEQYLELRKSILTKIVESPAGQGGLAASIKVKNLIPEFATSGVKKVYSAAYNAVAMTIGRLISTAMMKGLDKKYSKMTDEERNNLEGGCSHHCH